ncbi:tetratricopeptide repeat protein [Pedobacter alpinus]|uniref:Tetratricopeptide repeat-containing protein n=1 Tax=Pedobacter alpinus TaxID=1590643 RepID=A0ABW5TMW4_9SPHI
MKNLTAHYNIYFNAKESLLESKRAITNSYEDDFSQLLAIFPVPSLESSGNETENLDNVILKANTIALEKYESNWLDDSFLLLADAQYLKGDFYNAIEYYSYVGLNFEKEKENKLKAYLGQVKSDFALDLIKEADSVLKMAVALKYKYHKDQVAASQAKLALINNNIDDAIMHLENAVKFTKNNQQKIRWRYVLAQLQEINGKTKDAAYNYEKIAKSNASFEMSFNANLARIRISENAEGKTFDKIATLKKLLKEDKNRQLKDQIYYQIGNAYDESNDLGKASENFVIAAHTIPGTAKQKGLSYLRLAQLNFEKLKNYTQAQLYYDSTLQYLPKNYPDYKNIAVKAKNLQYLADRLIIIQKEKDKLYLASLSDTELDTKVDSIYQSNVKTNVKLEQNTNTGQSVSISDFSSANKTASSFYFYNDAAISQGFSEFKRRWGDRKLTDNWRISTSNLAASNTDKGLNPLDPDIDTDLTAKVESRDSLKSKLLRTLPFTIASKNLSYDKISTSLYEIAVFYKDELNDESESIAAFEAILINFPNDKNAANIYYQLYRLTAVSDPKKSEYYKQKLLGLFPDSNYARSITDPNYGKEKDYNLSILKNEYQNAYQMYNQKNYSQVLAKITQLKSKYGSFEDLSPQFAYLEALAIGNTQKTPVFLASLNQIVANYPANSEVTPLVKRQINFIGINRTAFDQRPTALLSRDDNAYNYIEPQLAVLAPVKEKLNVVDPVKTTPEPLKEKVIEKPIIKKEVIETPKEPIKTEQVVIEKPKEIVKPVPIVVEEPKEPAKTEPAVIETPKEPVKFDPVVVEEPKEIIIAKEPEVEKPIDVPVVEKPIEKVEPAVILPEKPKSLVFSTNERQRHLIVIDISDPKQNIAQPFSKLSQYFYSKFDPSQVKLVIRIVGGTEKFIIISGNFVSKKDVDLVADELKNNLPKIMEGQTTDYTQFVVSEENLKLLTDKKAIDEYLKSITPKK